MEVITLLFDLAEKVGLLAAAAVVAVLFPPLRNRLLGVGGQQRDRLAAIAIGLALSVWGTTLGIRVLGEYINLRAIGVLIAAILGGTKAGALTGLGSGLFYIVYVRPEIAPWVLLASVLDGGLAGRIASKAPRTFQGGRAFLTSIAVQLVHVVVVGGGLVLAGKASHYVPAWPAHCGTLIVNATGVTLFVVVAKVVVSREEAAVALVAARAEADAAALDSLRRRLEPHFLFNALNTLRATIRTSPLQARELVSDLADLYRYLLRHPEDAPLSEEANHACAYLAIERARLGEGRLQVQCCIEAEVRDIRVPALLLQPLVENAVKHGVARRDGLGHVEIRAWREPESLCISVEDRSQGRARAAVEPGSGIAIDTLRQRLRHRFGPSSLQMIPLPEGMRVLLRLPWSAVAGEGQERSAA